LYFTREGFIAAGPARIRELMATGLNLIAADETDQGRISLPKLIFRDGFSEVTHLLVEPGPTLAQSFFNAGAADRIWIIDSAIPGPAGGAIAPALPARYVKTREINLDGNHLSEFLDTESDLFFAAVESADLVVARSSH
jgi:riboflavin biosynthesis pyrimidine reductase